jgi:hypothetical protein
MKHNKARKYSHYACADCSVKFTKYYFACPFCDKLITANVPYFVAGFIGVFAILMATILTTLSQF